MGAELCGLAEESLELLRGVLYDERFPALFELPIYGSIIGMFELNNLGVSEIVSLIISGSPVYEEIMPVTALTGLIRGLSDRATCMHDSL